MLRCVSVHPLKLEKMQRHSSAHKVSVNIYAYYGSSTRHETKYDEFIV